MRKSLQLLLETPEGKRIRQIQGLKLKHEPKAGKQVVARFASSELRPGDYIVRLNGLNSQGVLQMEAYSGSIQVRRRSTSSR